MRTPRMKNVRMFASATRRQVVKPMRMLACIQCEHRIASCRMNEALPALSSAQHAVLGRTALIKFARETSSQANRTSREENEMQ